MIACIIQARMGSSRLPGKVLKKICGKTVIELEYERLKSVKKIDRIVIATSTLSQDDPIAELCKEKGIDFFRGNESDVLDRYYQAAKSLNMRNGDAVIRATGDCPLIDPDVVEKVIELFQEGIYDYAANINPPTFPHGFDIEILKYSVLERVWKEADLLSEREHVTLHVRNHPEKFLIGNLYNDEDFSKVRVTLDEPEDFEVIKSVFEALYDGENMFGMEDIIKFLNNNKEIQERNSRFVRDEGLRKSLANDRKVVSEK